MKRTIFALIMCFALSATAVVANPTLDNVVSDQIVLVEDLSTDFSVDVTDLTNEVSITCNLKVLEGVENVPIVSQDNSYTTFTFFDSFCSDFNTSAITTNTFLSYCQKLKPLCKSVATGTTLKTATSGFVIQDYPVPIKS